MQTAPRLSHLSYIFGVFAICFSDDRVVVIAATNRPDALDPALRRAGRFDREIEIGIPTENKRREILQRMLTSIPHSITEEELTQIASVTHGYVGADLQSICREAAIHALQRWQKQLQTRTMESKEEKTADDSASSSPSSSFDSLLICHSDLVSAVSSVRPSAMREVVLDVPKVSWDDIGGQIQVKQKLKEAVEWPLQNPQAFIRLGITPPKGILLYGPPVSWQNYEICTTRCCSVYSCFDCVLQQGCSKTLLAKALANESSRNFIAVKGPEVNGKVID